MTTITATLNTLRVISQYLLLAVGGIIAFAKKVGQETFLPYLAIIYTGEQGFEPRQADPESTVLPLDDSPINYNLL